MKASKKIISTIIVFTIISTIVTFSVNAASTPDDSTENIEIQNYETLQEDIDLAIEIADAKPLIADKTTSTLAREIIGSYPLRKGIILSTPTNASLGGLTFVGHAAIVYDTHTVVESLGDGVVTGSNNWYASKTKCYGITVRSTNASQDESVAEWCYKRIGCPYNYNFLDVNARDKFYCSQLVWAGFKDVCGINLNTSTLGAIITPMELVNTDETMKVYSKE